MKTLDELRDDVIDSRDLIEAIEEWESKVKELMNDRKECDINEEDEYWEAKEELERIVTFCEPFEGYGDWEHGEILIAEDYFVEYCEELIKDIGDLPQEIPNYIEIDWEKTADNLSYDYTLDNGYYMRSY